MLLKGNLHLSKARGGLPRLGAGKKKQTKVYFAKGKCWKSSLYDLLLT